MANQLDLEEQEQLDQLKHFWKQYGNAITWILIVVLAAFASWNFYQYWQRNQATQAAALFDEVDRSVQTADPAKVERVFLEMKDRFGNTIYAQQSALLVAKHYVDSGKPDKAKVALTWVADQSSDKAFQALAKLRLAAILLNEKNYDAALALMNGDFPVSFDGLVADRKGDALVLKAERAKAIAEYEKAWRLLDIRTEYRRLVEVKLNALGVNVLEREQAAMAAGK
jgi:predicted negative regulator of RcsB-dependent stress response